MAVECEWEESGGDQACLDSKGKKKTNPKKHPKQTKSPMQNDQCSISEKVISII